MHGDRLHDEEGRLAALRRYDILDTPEEAPFQRIVELAQLMVDGSVAAVTLIDAERQWVKAASDHARSSIPREMAFCSQTILQLEPLVVPDASLDPRFRDNPLVVNGQVRAYLGVPLTTPEGYNVGSLCVSERTPRSFAPAQIEMLRKLADIVVEQMELRQIAKQDALTGALTRRGFYAEIEKEYRRATRYDRPSALVLIDIDGFQGINDRYGHVGGDAVLVAIAHAVMADMRRSDLFGRTGGGQFGLLLPETDGEEATLAAERVRRAVESAIVETPAGDIRATVSVGVAPRPPAGEDMAVWLAEADIALYEAKQFGRNRVVAGRTRRAAAVAEGVPIALPQLH